MIFNSDFTTNSLDTQIWRTGWFKSGISGPINQHEIACYNGRNVSLPGTGVLDLTISKVPSTCEGAERPYTGAMISTNPNDGRKSGGFSYTYGVAQARIYVPSDRGLIADWPAFVTLGQKWPQSGEDDIMEGISGMICSRFHSPINAMPGLGGCDIGFTPGWHTLTADWEPNSISWYYDGIRVFHETTGVTSSPMYLVLVNTVSGKWAQLAAPDTMEVAYVRVWQPAGTASGHSLYRYRY